MDEPRGSEPTGFSGEDRTDVADALGNVAHHAGGVLGDVTDPAGALDDDGELHGAGVDAALADTGPDYMTGDRSAVGSEE